MLLDLVDVFGSGTLSGNPLAVVRGGEGLDAAQMLRLTQWLGFSETTFLLPPTEAGADYRVRIFYPAGELPFAGHPTLGSAFAWLRAGGQPQGSGVVVQQCDAGLIEVRLDGDRLAFAAPAFTRYGPVSAEETAEAARLAGVDPADIVEAMHVANGPKWQLLRLSSAADVLAARPEARAPVGTDIGLAGPHEHGGEVDWELRAFFANQHGAVVEDPVTGSFNAGVAMHLFASGLAQGSYVAGQGQVTGAHGRVQCEQDAEGRVWIGGRCAMVAGGAMVSLPA
jgi:PhzF family phenazine biosynthesis protein